MHSTSDRHICQWCRGQSKDRILNVHHIESRKTGGDSPDNLVTVCETCHNLIHRTHQESKIARSGARFRDACQMSIIRWRIYEQFAACFARVRLTYLIKMVRRNNRQLKPVQRATALLVERRTAFPLRKIPKVRKERARPAPRLRGRVSAPGTR